MAVAQPASPSGAPIETAASLPKRFETAPASDAGLWLPPSSSVPPPLEPTLLEPVLPKPPPPLVLPHEAAPSDAIANDANMTGIAAVLIMGRPSGEPPAYLVRRLARLLFGERLRDRRGQRGGAPRSPGPGQLVALRKGAAFVVDSP